MPLRRAWPCGALLITPAGGAAMTKSLRRPVVGLLDAPELGDWPAARLRVGTIPRAASRVSRGRAAGVSLCARCGGLVLWDRQLRQGEPVDSAKLEREAGAVICADAQRCREPVVACELDRHVVIERGAF